VSLGKDLLAVLGGIAPGIATAVGGPLGGIAMKFLADKFTGGDPEKVEEYLMSADPTVLKELRMADMEFQRHMRKLDIDLDKINAEDRASARDMAKTTGFIPQVVMSAIYTCGYFAILYMFMQGLIKVPPEHVSMFNGLLGVLSAAQVQIINFWFGSSAGSKTKTEVMSNGKSS
jgi:hypothetical protein